MRGAECEPVAIFFRSVPQIPQVWTRSKISPGPISGTGTSSRRTSFTPRYTAALIVEGISRLSLSTASVDVRATAMAECCIPVTGSQVECETEVRCQYVRQRTDRELSFDSIRPRKTRPANSGGCESHEPGNLRGRRKAPGLPWHCSVPIQW